MFFVAVRIGQLEDGLIGLRQSGVADYVAAVVFGHVALAFLVDEDREFNRLEDVRRRGVARRRPRNALNIVHADGQPVDVLDIAKHFARRARLIRRVELGETRIEETAHFGVGRITAGRRNNALYGAPVLFLAVYFHLNAQNAPGRRIFTNDARHLVTGKNFQTDFLGVGNAGLDVVASALSFRIAAARPQTAVNLIDAGTEDDADLLQPFHAFGSAARQNLNECRIGAVVARRQRLFGMKFGRILHAGRLRILGDGGVQPAARNHGVASGKRHFFEHDRLGAELFGRNARGQSGPARTDHDDVPRLIPLLRNTAEIGGFGGQRDGTDGRRHGARQQTATRDLHNYAPFSLAINGSGTRPEPPFPRTILDRSAQKRNTECCLVTFRYCIFRRIVCSPCRFSCSVES